MKSVVAETISVFDSDLSRIFGTDYFDLLLFGSSISDEFVPGKGDIDFTVVLTRDINQTDEENIVALHERYRTRVHGYVLEQLEGTYYPKRIIENPNRKGKGYYIGTKRIGWKTIDIFYSSLFDLVQMKENGISIRKNKRYVYKPKKKELMSEIRKNMEMWNINIKNETIPLHAPAQWIARTIYYLENQKTASKKEACLYCTKILGKNEIWNQCGNIQYPYDGNKLVKRNNENIEIVKHGMEYLAGIMKRNIPTT